MEYNNKVKRATEVVLAMSYVQKQLHESGGTTVFSSKHPLFSTKSDSPRPLPHVPTEHRLRNVALDGHITPAIAGPFL
jgi:hypothetical protein